MLIWSEKKKKGNIVELTVPWETAADEAHERKLLKYEELILVRPAGTCKSAREMYLPGHPRGGDKEGPMDRLQDEPGNRF